MIASPSFARLPFSAISGAALAILFLFHIYPVGLGDVYWHLNTGRWIWENGTLPEIDPFTYTLAETGGAGQSSISGGYWQQLILQGYWLAQLVFLGMHAAFGPWGLVVLKASLFAALYWIVWRTLLRAQVEPVLGLLAILVLPWLLYRYDELRPQIFSFLGVALVFMNLSHALAALRNGVRHPVALVTLPVVMLLWANLHPGFMLGWVVVMALLAGAVSDQWRGTNVMDRRALLNLLVWCGTALLASLANPLSAKFITNMIVLKDQYTLGVDEFLPLFTYAGMYQQPFLFYGVLALALATAGVLVRRWRSVHPAHAFLFAGFAIAGFYAFRYTIFFVLMALMIAMPHASALLEPHLKRIRLLMFALLFAAISGAAYLTVQRGAWKLGPVETAYVPEHAAGFILAQHPPAPLFNAYEYGGYLGWRLTPEYRMFIDPRCLDYEVFNDYQTARGGHYQGVFEKYGVNSVVFYLFTPLVNSIPEVTLYLLMDERWDLVYVDRLTAVMVRRERNNLPALEKTPLLNYLQHTLEQTLTSSPGDTQAHVQYGRVLLYRGNVDGARHHFNVALQIDPRLRAPRLYLEALSRKAN